MTVLKSRSSCSLAVMNDKLWLEKSCCNLIPDLSLWIIEYAWSKRMMEVIEVLGPPLWLEGDWCLLTLEEPCKIRVVSAEVWRIVQTRDIKNFERVIKFLDVTYMLVPRLVTPIKHMKVMFGLQTLVIMWMVWNDRSAADIDEKIESLFPDNLSQYYKCSRKHMELMRKNREDFKRFAHALVKNRNMRETYIRETIEEQYGERYAQKLEERLSHYLEELDKSLTQSTCIQQVLDEPLTRGPGEKILKDLLSRDDTSLDNVLRRLINCAATSNLSLDDVSPSQKKTSPRTLHVITRPSQDSAKETNSNDLFASQGLWQRRKESQESLVESHDDGRMTASTHEPIGCSPSLLETPERIWQHKHTETDSETEIKPERTEQMCTRHGQKIKSILQESSVETCGDGRRMASMHESIRSTPSLPERILQHKHTETESKTEPERTEQMCTRHGKKIKSILQESSVETCGDGRRMASMHESIRCTPSLPERIWQHKHTETESETEPERTEQMCSRHGKKMKSILQECSEELDEELVQALCTPTTPESTPSLILNASQPVTQNSTNASSSTNISLSSIDEKVTSPASLLLRISSSSSLLRSSLSSMHCNAAKVNAEELRDVLVEPDGRDLKLSRESQSFLMRSKWLQPQVCLYRLSMKECNRITNSSESDEEVYAFFDANTLYSDSYSDSDSTDSDDPDYDPKRE